MFDKALCHLGNMHQTVLMHTYIHKCSEIDHVSHRSFEDHALFQVLHIQDICAQHRFRHLLTGITSRLGELFYNVPQGHLTHAQLFRHLFVVFHIIYRIAAKDIRRLHSHAVQEFFCCFIALGMDTGGIQRILPACDAQEAGTLLKGFRPQLGYF